MKIGVFLKSPWGTYVVNLCLMAVMALIITRMSARADEIYVAKTEFQVFQRDHMELTQAIQEDYRRQLGDMKETLKDMQKDIKDLLARAPRRATP